MIELDQIYMLFLHKKGRVKQNLIAEKVIP